MKKYIAMYKKERAEIFSKDLWTARTQAGVMLGVARSKQHHIHIRCAESDGKEITYMDIFNGNKPNV